MKNVIRWDIKRWVVNNRERGEEAMEKWKERRDRGGNIPIK
jgi:hypothetical protein